MSVRTDQVNMNVTINGERAGSTLNDLRKKSRELKAELNKLPIASDEFKNKAAELTSVNKNIGNITKDLRGMNSAWGDISKSFAGFTVAAMAFQAGAVIKNFVKDSVAAYNEAASGEAQLLNALGGRRDVQDRLLAQAKEMQKNTVFQDDQIVAAQTYLAAQKLTEDQIKKTIKAAVQLATVTGQDLQTVTEQLAGTYEGVSGKMGKLDSDIKGLSKEQMENGAVIDLVNKKYEGFAETAAKTGEGPLQQMNNEFNDLQEVVGKYLMPAITGIVQGFRWFMGLLEPLITSVDTLFSSLGLTGGAMTWFKTTIQVLLSPLALLIQSTTWFIDKIISIVPALSGVGAVFSTFFTEIKQMAYNVFGGIGELIEGVFTMDWNKVKAGVDRMKAGAAKMGSDMAEAYTTAYRKKLADMKAGDVVAPSTGENTATATAPNTPKDPKNDPKLKYAKQFQQLMVDNIADGAERERAQLLLKYQDELEQYGLHFDNLNNLTADEQAIVEQLSIKYGKQINDIAAKYDMEQLEQKQETADETVAIVEKAKTKEQKVLRTHKEWYEENEQKIQDIMYSTLDVVASVSSLWQQHLQAVVDNEQLGSQERIRAAKHLKMVKIAEASIILASTLLQDGLSSNWVKFAADAALGAIQLGTIIGTPIPQYARGHITNGPEMAVVGEDGPEAVIPLSGKYRQYAMPLFAQTATALGFGVQQAMPVAGGNRQGGGDARTDMMLMKLMYKMERTVDKLNARIEEGLPTYLEFNQFERDLKRVSAIRGES